MKVGRRSYNQDRPAARRVESRGKTQNGAAGLRPRIPAVGRHVLKERRDRELNLDQRSRPGFLAGDGRGAGDPSGEKDQTGKKESLLHQDNESDSTASRNPDASPLSALDWPRSFKERRFETAVFGRRFQIAVPW
jgi:hypothetical protein